MDKFIVLIPERLPVTFSTALTNRSCRTSENLNHQRETVTQQLRVLGER